MWVLLKSRARTMLHMLYVLLAQDGKSFFLVLPRKHLRWETLSSFPARYRFIHALTLSMGEEEKASKEKASFKPVLFMLNSLACFHSGSA